ncbi:MAG: hypothetical protein QOD60_1087 [Solirubrobacterales bacterium]|nr:hypothetical protein [Solirubrobacterales bacterium]
MDPEGAGSERKGIERVGAGAGQRDGRQRGAVVGREVEQELVGGRGGEGLDPEEDADQRQRHVDQQREAAEEVGRREQVLDAQTPWQLRTQNGRDALEAAARPSLLLGDVGGHVLGAEAAGQDLRHVGAAPAALVEPNRELEVLGQRVLGKAAHLLERLATEDDVGSAAERRPDPVLAAADRPEEEALLRGRGRRDRARAGVCVVLRRLHVSDEVLLEVADGALEEVRVGYMIAVENGDDRRIGDRQSVVEVAGLGPS